MRRALRNARTYGAADDTGGDADNSVHQEEEEQQQQQEKQREQQPQQQQAQQQREGRDQESPEKDQRQRRRCSQGQASTSGASAKDPEATNCTNATVTRNLRGRPRRKAAPAAPTPIPERNNSRRATSGKKRAPPTSGAAPAPKPATRRRVDPVVAPSTAAIVEPNGSRRRGYHQSNHDEVSTSWSTDTTGAKGAEPAQSSAAEQEVATTVGEPLDAKNDEGVRLCRARVCGVCGDMSSAAGNVLLRCRDCGVLVHQSCQGQGSEASEFLCRPCWALDQGLATDGIPTTERLCELCPNKGGVLVEVAGSGYTRWAHMLCAIWVSEIFFEDADALVGAKGFDKRALFSRFKLRCMVCKRRNVGACLQCQHPKCFRAFHPSCALGNGYHLRYNTNAKDEVSLDCFCRPHEPYAVLDGSESFADINMKEGLAADENHPTFLRLGALYPNTKDGGKKDRLIQKALEAGKIATPNALNNNSNNRSDKGTHSKTSSSSSSSSSRTRRSSAKARPGSASLPRTKKRDGEELLLFSSSAISGSSSKPRRLGDIEIRDKISVRDAREVLNHVNKQYFSLPSVEDAMCLVQASGAGSTKAFLPGEMDLAGFPQLENYDDTDFTVLSVPTALDSLFAKPASALGEHLAAQVAVSTPALGKQPELGLAAGKIVELGLQGLVVQDRLVASQRAVLLWNILKLRAKHGVDERRLINVGKVGANSPFLAAVAATLLCRQLQDMEMRFADLIFLSVRSHMADYLRWALDAFAVKSTNASRVCTLGILLDSWKPQAVLARLRRESLKTAFLVSEDDGLRQISADEAADQRTRLAQRNPVPLSHAATLFGLSLDALLANASAEMPREIGADDPTTALGDRLDACRESNLVRIGNLMARVSAATALERRDDEVDLVLQRRLGKYLDHQAKVAAEQRLKQEQDQAALCRLCGGGESKFGNLIVICDKCENGYHERCHKIPIDLSVDEWFCINCCNTASRSPRNGAMLAAGTSPVFNL